MKLIQLVDSLEYVRTNCWQHQLMNHLSKEASEHKIVTLAELATSSLPDTDIILSTLKLRSLARECKLLKSRLGDRQVFIYEQDPWENFTDQGSCRGTYEWCRENLNVKSFIITSQWWADYVASQGFKTRFTQMWMNDILCDEGTPWSSRPINVGFMGTLHPHRKKAIAELARLGIDVQVFPSKSYDEYLNTLSQMQFFFHDEASANWTIDGKLIEQNALWAKEIEIASRGCFALRQYESEAEAYMAGQIPCILPFLDIADLPGIIRTALENPMSDAYSKISVEMIRSHRGWFKLTDL